MEAPSQAITAWLAAIVRQFVAVGRGHDVECSARFLMALRRVDSNMAVNIEHKDFELDHLKYFTWPRTTSTPRTQQPAPEFAGCMGQGVKKRCD
jgi:hypothetical protein